MKYYVFFISLLFCTTAFANSIQASLQKKITQAQQHLTKTENSIVNARKKVLTQLNRLEAEVLTLREQASVAQRLADEKTLSLSKLENRLTDWRKQDAYQQNLLHRFLKQQPQFKHNNTIEIDESTSQQVQNRLFMVNDIAKNLQSNLKPSWHSQSVVMSSGEIKAIPTLKIGPVTWYWNTATEQAGLASIHDKAQDLLHSDLILSNSASNAIKQLRTEQVGSIMLDPTLKGAMVKEQHNESILQHVMKGGLWALPIIAFALFALIIALVKSIQLIRLPKLIRFTPAALTNVLTSTDTKRAVNVRGMQKVLLDIAQNSSSPRKRDDELFIELQDNKLRLERWISGIAVTAAISPLLGLLGTVSGMIETFKMMTLFGSGDPSVVSGGIAQALVTTELGLVVAIPALILNAILSRRAKAYYNELEGFAILLSKAHENYDVSAKLVSNINTDKAAQKTLETDRDVMPKIEEVIA